MYVRPWGEGVSELRPAIEWYRSEPLGELPGARAEVGFSELWAAREAIEAEVLSRLAGRGVHTACPSFSRRMVRIDGDLDPETGEAVLTAIGSVQDACARSHDRPDARTPAQAQGQRREGPSSSVGCGRRAEAVLVPRSSCWVCSALPARPRTTRTTRAGGDHRS
jgi:hypothetical protein